MSIIRTFRAEEWDVTGELGWKPLWIPGFDPITNAAHDILEHTGKESGELWEECKAFGAMTLLRWENGYSNKYGRQLDKADFSTDMVRFFEENRYVRRAPPTRKLAEHVEQFYAEFRHEFREDWLANDNDPSGIPTHSEIDNVIAWMRVGYRAARLRYKDMDTYTVGCYLFDKINEGVQKIPLEEGIEMKVIVDLKYAGVKFDYRYPDDDF